MNTLFLLDSREFKEHILTGQLFVDSGKGVQFVLENVLVLCVQEAVLLLHQYIVTLLAVMNEYTI